MSSRFTHENAGPLVERIADRLRDYVMTHCQPGQRLPSQTSLAKRFGCSNKTVNLAVALLTDEGAVRSHRGSGTYVSSDLPALTGITGLHLVTTYRGPLLWQGYELGIVQGVLDAARQVGRSVSVFGRYEAKPYSVAQVFVDHGALKRLDSMICAEVFDHSALESLGRRLATVSVDMPCFAPGVSSVVVDHEQMLELAVEHLWANGHRRIGFYNAPAGRDQDPAHSARCAALKRSLRKRQADPHEGWDCPLPRRSKVEPTALWLRRWLETPSNRRPTAMVCDGHFWLLAHVCAAHAVEIPQQLSILWIEAAEEGLSSLSTPQPEHIARQLQLPRRPWDSPRGQAVLKLVPTRAEVSFYEMGQWAMGEAVRRATDHGATPRHHRVAGRLAEGNTVGPAPAT